MSDKTTSGPASPVASGTPTEPDLVNDWFTLPGWTRAHALADYGSMGATTLYVTECEREYRLPDPEMDEPIVAPAGMPRCKPCVASRESAGGAR